MNVYFFTKTNQKLGIKPFEIILYDGPKILYSIGFKRVKNVYLNKNKVVL